GAAGRGAAGHQHLDGRRPAAVVHLLAFADDRLRPAHRRLPGGHHRRVHHLDPLRHPGRALLGAHRDRGPRHRQAGPARLCPVGLSALLDLRRDCSASSS
ncbi:MAG: hypothetical protein MZV70_75705, partial [Desulfobacterales bacterium]|nr:hypothetical protein [Desulfobacterales bacterium]